MKSSSQARRKQSPKPALSAPSLLGLGVSNTKPALSDLPDDPAVLKQLLLQMAGELDTVNSLNSRLERQLQASQENVSKLSSLLATLNRGVYGKSSEKLQVDRDQLELALDAMHINNGSLEEQIDQARAIEGKAPVIRPSSARKPLPDSLEREVRTYLDDRLSQDNDKPICIQCNAPVKSMGEDITEELEYVPARLKVIRHIRPKFACACCNTVIQHPAISRPIRQGMAGPGLLAHILVSKYADHQPLYRQAEIFARQGIDLDRGTLGKWVGRITEQLNPLVQALQTYVFEASKLHGDDTTIPVLDSSLTRTKTGRLWTYVRDDHNSSDQSPKAVWFAYSPDRKAQRPTKHLKNFRGTLQCDAYGGYNESFRTHDIQPAFCWAHVRRQFYNLSDASLGANAQGKPNLADQAVQKIAALYQIESQIRGKPADERLRIRQLQSIPILNELKKWAQDCALMVGKKTEIAKVLNYLLKRWEGFERYAHHGELEIDNNIAENSIRPIALGRKNYLFAGSDRGAETAASLYSLMGTAKANGIEPFAYLKEVIARIGEHKINRVHELLPWNIKHICTKPATE